MLYAIAIHRQTIYHRHKCQPKQSLALQGFWQEFRLVLRKF